MVSPVRAGRRLARLGWLPLALSLGCEFADSSAASEPPAPIVPKRYNLIPLPRTVVERDGAFDLVPESAIATHGSDMDIARVAGGLSDALRAATGYPIPV